MWPTLSLLLPGQKSILSFILCSISTLAFEYLESLCKILLSIIYYYLLFKFNIVPRKFTIYYTRVSLAYYFRYVFRKTSNLFRLKELNKRKGKRTIKFHSCFYNRSTENVVKGRQTEKQYSCLSCILHYILYFIYMPSQ